MAQNSQVWWSWPGGVGWGTTIPLKGGKSKTRKQGSKAKKSRKVSRKGRKATRRR